MKYKDIFKKMTAVLFALVVMSSTTSAQEFSVASFRLLPNDVSAFIDNVRDLNDEACALIKVEAPSDFAFSTPLGIVKRKDEVGEIWIYLPKGTRTLTLKHPEWGVLRDYPLGKPLESRMTYEMKLNLPQLALTEVHDTIVQVKTIRDTVAITPSRPRTPLSAYALATVAFHQDGPSYGLFLAMMRKHGFFLHASSDGRRLGATEGNCLKDGSIDGTGTKPYYSGETRHSNYTVTVGAIHSIYRNFNLFEGIGYGRAATAWQKSEIEGGGYLLNEGLTHKGIAAEVGILASFDRLAVSASALTVAGKQWQASIGVGIRIGK